MKNIVQVVVSLLAIGALLKGMPNLALAAPLEPLTACSGVVNTPYFTLVYGEVKLNGLDAPVGTAIEAYSPRGDKVGCFEVNIAGYFGSMYIYGEDNSVLPPIPGMRNGESIQLWANGFPLASMPAISWNNDRAFHELAATNLQVERINNDIRLNWYATNTGVSRYEIWRATSPYFSPGSSGSSLIANVPAPASPGVIFRTDTGKYGDASTYYYLLRGVDTSGRSSISNRSGKFYFSLEPGWNLLTLPLALVNTSPDDVLGSALFGTDSPDTADRILVWESASQTYDSAWFCGGPECESWGEPWANHWLASDYSRTTIEIVQNMGFWLHNRSGNVENFKILGQVIQLDRSVPIGPGWQMIGSAIPVSELLDNANVPATGTDSPDTADRILYWDALSQSYQSAWFCGGTNCESWGEPWANHWLASDYSPSPIVLQPGKGFWFHNRHGALVWDNQVP